MSKTVLTLACAAGLGALTLMPSTASAGRACGYAIPAYTYAYTTCCAQVTCSYTYTYPSYRYGYVYPSYAYPAYGYSRRAARRAWRRGY